MSRLLISRRFTAQLGLTITEADAIEVASMVENFIQANKGYRNALKLALKLAHKDQA
jgi:hypothetical protein